MEEKRFILTCLHFNLEFVAGEYNTYDKLLNEAFEPALDLFLECPEWHAEIEVSGMHLEFCARFFPWIIKKLKTLNDRGQIDIICVHYSETIWPAFPREDFYRSWAIDKVEMDKLGLKFAPTFFAQENFFGEGVAAINKLIGIQNAIIPEKNYAWPYHALEPLYPVYDMKGLNLVVRGDSHHDGKWWVYKDNDLNLCIKWTYDKCGDGEPWVGGDPYVDFWRSPEKIKQKQDLYAQERAAGTQFLTTHEFVQTMGKLGIKKPPLKPVPDGPWGLEKPGIFQWMGLYFSFYELDVEMRSLSFRSRAMLLAAQTLVEIAEKAKMFVGHYRYMLDHGWRKQINSEVSDSSGWVPTLPEMYYGIDNALTAFYWGEKIIRDLREKLKLPDHAIDTKEKMPIPRLVYLNRQRTPMEVPKEYNVQTYGGKQKLEYFQIDDKTAELEYTFLQNEIDTGIKFAFYDPEALRYSPALMDDAVVVHPLKDYGTQCQHLYFPLPNGLINLASDVWIVKHNDCSHVACKVNFVDKKLEFMMLTNLMALGGREQLGIDMTHHWKFTIFKGSAEDAVKLALKINIFPTVPFDYVIWPQSPYPWIPFTRMVTK